jgi:hypothetical protein
MSPSRGCATATSAANPEKATEPTTDFPTRQGRQDRTCNPPPSASLQVLVLLGLAHQAAGTRRLMPVWFTLASRVPYAGKWVFLIFDKKRAVALSAEAIADELETNAEIAARCEPHGSASRPQDLVFRFEEWDAQRNTLRLISHKGSNPELWKDVRRVYEGLRQTATVGAYPPWSDDLPVGRRTITNRALLGGIRRQLRC